MLRRSARVLGIVLVLGSLLVAGRWWTGNFGTVAPGAVYRSGQLSASGLERVVRKYRIQTVVNLRGCNPEQAWYRAERAATLAAGATQVDIAMASDQWLSRPQLRAIIEVLERSPRPMLIHCEWGAERTGLVAALATLLDPAGSLAAARGAFTPYHLFLPVKDGRMMLGHVAAYRDWLAARGQPHTPTRFREWTGSYRPGTPSREQWPYDPYPLVVVSRPPADAGAAEPSRQMARETAATTR
jgi:protein tyrosine phosphatase (PTP) superfamily phosphohydrolase (DUF442 family)